MSPVAPESSCAAAFLASSNHGERKDGRRPDTIILHYTGMASSTAALDWLRDPASKVSCHYFIWEDGRIVQLVSEGRRAWHAGQSSWFGETDLNSASVGIEIANPGHDGGLPPFPDAQIVAVIALCRDVSRRLGVPAARILAHSDIAPLRKSDPGEKFPWARLHSAGIGHYVTPVPIARDDERRHDDPWPAGIEALQSSFAAYGYDVPVSGVYCAKTEAVVRAFQRHFRPERVDGIADQSTVATLRGLIRTLPT
ncbi:MAG TPA: N-acetylmuramoyl-L-alanine amidase [Beijerinckiaceae bacterium]|nr:N-acetylmuramoyl-L-alanine amidase [Beijerinckiaceae bacterium]